MLAKTGFADTEGAAHKFFGDVRRARQSCAYVGEDNRQAGEMTLARRDVAIPEESAAALRRLSEGELRRLEQLARLRVIGLHAVDWRDLLQEAIARLLDGSRRWPRDVSLVVFLRETMRSIASDHWRRLEEPVVMSEAELGVHQETGEGALDNAIDPGGLTGASGLGGRDACPYRRGVQGRRGRAEGDGRYGHWEVTEGNPGGGQHEQNTICEHPAPDSAGPGARVSRRGVLK